MVVRKKTEGSEDLEDQQELIEINPNLKNVIQKEKDMMEIINIDKNGTAELLKKSEETIFIKLNERNKVRWKKIYYLKKRIMNLKLTIL